MNKKSVILLLSLLCGAPAWSADTPAATAATPPTQEQVHTIILVKIWLIVRGHDHKRNQDRSAAF